MESPYILEEKVINTLKKWKDDLKCSQLYVGVDIGGTNCRISFSNCKERLIALKFQTTGASDIIKAVKAVSLQVNNIGLSAIGASVAGAGRIALDGSQLEVTNYDAGDRVLYADKLPPILFPTNKTVFLNDLEATCYGVIALSDSGELTDSFKRIWGSGDVRLRGDPSFHYLVIAVGTGLGIATLLSLRGTSEYHVLPMEFGHSTVALAGIDTSFYEKEIEVLSKLSQQLYFGKYAIEYEDLVSGRGLQHAYNALVSEKHDDTCKTGPEIAIAAMKDGSKEEEALLIYFRFLFRIAKNLCIGLQARGIILAGGNQVKNNEFMMKHMDTLRKEFTDHPKAEWVKDVEIFTKVSESINLNLVGAEYVARKQANKPLII